MTNQRGQSWLPTSSSRALLVTAGVILVASFSRCRTAMGSSSSSPSCATTAGTGTTSTAQEAAAAAAGTSNYTSEDENLTQLTVEAAAKLGASRPVLVPRWVTRISRAVDRCVLAILHCAWCWDSSSRRRRPPPNSKLSLQVLVWKAMVGKDPTSPAFDGGLAYDMLPPFVRVLVPRRRFSPKLMIHTIMEIRIVYLDRCVREIADKARARDPSVKVRLVSMGAGYDVRSMRLRVEGVVDEAVEFDLPDVVEAKAELLQSERFRRSRPEIAEDKLPRLRAIDLNEVQLVKVKLEEMLRQPAKGDDNWHTIFLFEAVLMYLDPGAPAALLRTCRQVIDSDSDTASDHRQRAAGGGSLCFADDLEELSGSNNRDVAARFLAGCGWKLLDWLPRGGRSRHMGYAELA